MKHRLAFLLLPVFLTVTPMTTMSADDTSATTFRKDVEFLRAHTSVIVLRDAAGAAQVALVPAWQGRVMTSTAGGDGGASYGWINRELIASGTLQPHINVFGGEDRFWLGPEGGQFSIFFAKGAKFELGRLADAGARSTRWRTTCSTRPPDRVTFGARFPLTNYSGTRFDVQRQARSPLAVGRRGLERRSGVAPRRRRAARRVRDRQPHHQRGHARRGRRRPDCCPSGFSGCSTRRPPTTIVVPIKRRAGVGTWT